MQAALRGQGSVHLSGTGMVLIPPRSRVGIDVTGDVSWRTRRAHTVTVSRSWEIVEHRAALDSERDEAVFVGDRSAVRTGSGPWDCEPTGLPAMPYDPARVPPRVSELMNRGEESLRGRPVWHVFVTGRDEKLNEAETIDYYIGRHDFLPWRAVVSETITAGPSAGTTTRLVVD